MAQITTTDANEFSSSAEFIPMRGFSNCHLQTMLPRLFRRQVKFTPYWQRLELPDGDFVDLAWSENPAQAQHKPRLVVFHGLEGSLNSPYAHGLVEVAQKRGWLGVVMHFRGCSGEPNRMHRIYHSGETEDASWFLRWLQREFGHAPTAAVGYSLGGNMLACLLAKEGNDLPVDAAVIVSAPFMLEACSYHMEKGFSRVYQRYLLNRIAKPTLIIHAKDDPFMDHQVIPKPESLPPQVEYQLTEHGGHVGFIGGTLLHPQMWLESRIPDWLTTYLEAKSC
ncbi:TPA: hydrolase [Escherichia coli]|nr:hydrolase [Escherichia coli]